MGDRCYLSVTVRKDELTKFQELLPHTPSEEEEEELTVTLTYEDANYGYGDELTQAAAAGCEFYGYHGSGSSYDAAEFHSHMKGACYVYRGQDEYGIIIDGSTPQKRMENLLLAERLIAQRDNLIDRMNNPVYDLIKESE